MEDETVAAMNSDSYSEDNVQRAYTAFHLPLQCTGNPDTPRSEADDAAVNNKFPSITILVCADFDLHSTAALAEYAIQQKRQRQNKNDDVFFDAKSIDLIIAVGPSTGNTELLKYYNQGRNTKGNFSQNLATKYSRSLNIASDSNDHTVTRENTAGTATNVAAGLRRLTGLDPFFRSREESAALEGLVTAALSQLESIVCRVVYCPGYHDPISLLQQHQPNGIKRLTPHSRNIHQQYLPLAPGLGCAGLFYLDHTDLLIEHHGRRNRLKQTKLSTRYPKSVQRRSCNNDNNNDGSVDDDEDDEDSESSEHEDGYAILSDQIRKLQQFAGGYYPALEKLLQLAPNPKYPDAIFGSNKNNKEQSILISHYVDSRSLVDNDKSLVEDCDDNTGDDVGTLDDLYRNNDWLNDRKGHINSVPVNEDCDEDNDDDKGPWPSGHHKFLNSDTARQNLCFEIATGLTINHHPAEWIPTTTNETGCSGERSSTRNGVLFPGSLRDHGDFCIVQLLFRNHEPMSFRNNSVATRKFGWAVQEVKFHKLNKYST